MSNSDGSLTTNEVVTTSCWDCSHAYDNRLQECPHCGASNGNWDLARAQEELQVKDWILREPTTRESAPCKPT